MDQTGKVSGVQRTVLNMLVGRVLAETSPKKIKLQRKTNTTEVAVKPEKCKEKNPSAQYNVCLFQ